jgi:hypothetical protein
MTKTTTRAAETPVDIIRSEAPVPAVRQAGTPAQLLALAIDRGDADLDRLERLMRMQTEWEANEARKAFTVAMAAFKAEPLEIFKRKEVKFLDVHYFHAELADITDVLVPAMSRHGLLHRWETDNESPDGTIVVSCVITHVLGHSERVKLVGKADASGKKNPIQAIGSAVQYLQRYTLLAATGMSTKSTDDDGRGGEDEEDGNDPILDELRAASLEGEDALREAFKKFGPGNGPNGKPLPWPTWEKHGAALRTAAIEADKEA